MMLKIIYSKHKTHLIFMASLLILSACVSQGENNLRDNSDLTVSEIHFAQYKKKNTIAPGGWKQGKLSLKENCIFFTLEADTDYNAVVLWPDFAVLKKVNGQFIITGERQTQNGLENYSAVIGETVNGRGLWIEHPYKYNPSILKETATAECSSENQVDFNEWYYQPS